MGQVLLQQERVEGKVDHYLPLVYRQHLNIAAPPVSAAQRVMPASCSLGIGECVCVHVCCLPVSMHVKCMCWEGEGEGGMRCVGVIQYVN